MNGLPVGFGLDLDRSVRRYRNGSVVVGGHPGRLLTLGPAGVGAVAALLEGRPVSTAGRRLGARLVEAGMAHPRWDGETAHPRWDGGTAHPRWDGGTAHPRWEGETAHPRWDGRVTVVIPTLDRSSSLDRCLGALGPGSAVVVVDDGSADPKAVAEVCRRHRVRLVVRTDNGGPGAARNDALAVVDSEFVAFVDSDCTVTPGWLDPLLRLFDDPAIAAVAPRLRPEPVGGTPSVCRRYAAARSPLDMGGDPSEVGPGRVVRYVPTAALVVRRAALREGFDPAMRVGEDVDLVWRLLADGWRIRYEPSVTVHHREPGRWAALLGRRFRYGTSAAPLADRHPGSLSPVELRPWPTLAAGALLVGRPRTAAAAVLASGTRMAVTLGRKGVPVGRSLLWSVGGAGWTLVGMGRAVTMLAAPVALVAARRNRRSGTAVGLLLVTPPLVEWWRRRPALDPFRWSVASVADDMAYGAGVWVGCLSARSFAPLLPTVRLSGRNASTTDPTRSHPTRESRQTV